MSHARRLTALGAAAALVVPALAALAPQAAAAPAIVVRDVREHACPPGQVGDQGFTDVSGTGELPVNCLVDFGITRGKTTTTYAPTETVSRAQMALFLVRVADLAGVPLDTRSAGFVDVAALSQEARDAVNALANLGVAQGRAGNRFDPTGAVQRGAMASFIKRLQDEVGDAFTSTDDYFADDTGSVHEVNINALAAAGVVQGVAVGDYDFEKSVSRQQMALFLTRYLDLLVEEGAVEGVHPRDNEVLSVEPGEQATIDVGAERAYTATALTPGVTYRITVVQTATTSAGPDGTTRFTDSDGDRLADVGSSSARITKVNGAAASGTPATTTATPDAQGRLTFSLGAGAAGDDVVPVVYDAGGLSPRLELASDLRPLEVFGVGGRLLFRAPSAPSSDNGADGTVTLHERPTSRVTVDTGGDGLGDLVYVYDDGDIFRVGGTLTTREDFVAKLTRGDRLTVGKYVAGEGTSEFDISTNTPTAPSSVTAEETEPTGTVLITVTPSSPATPTFYDSFTVERATVTPALPGAPCTAPGGSVGAFTAFEPATADADPTTAGFQYVDRNVPAGCYRYRASGVVDGERSSTTASGNVESSGTPATPDTKRPSSTDARVARDFGSAGVGDTGDSWVVVFDEPLDAVPEDALIQVRPAGAATPVTIRNQEDAFFRVSGSTLTIDLMLGTSAGAYPLEITGAAGIRDASGNTWSLATSPDKVLDLGDPGA